jgi:hypothetical protein
MKGIIAKPEKTDRKGMTSTLYAKCDGELAPAGNKSDMLSPTTHAWLYFIMANPGAKYPLILNEF